MAKSKLVIANMALAKIGNSTPITSFTQSGSNEAAAINDVYPDVLEEVLSEHPWAFAQKRIALVAVVPDDVTRTIEGRIFTPVSITAATKAEPVVLTVVDHGLQNGDKIKIVGVSGMTQLNGNFYRIQGKTVDTIELIDEDIEDGEVEIDGTAFTTYTSGGQIQLANDSNPLPITAATAANPVVITSAAHGLATGDWIKILGVAGMTQLNGIFFIVATATTNTFSLTDTDGVAISGLAYSAYTYGGIILVADVLPSTDTGTVVVYEKPTDFIKPNKQSDVLAILKVEQDKIISNVEDLKLIYTFRNEDTTTYFAKFTQALVLRLAAEICFRITNSVSKAQELMKLYEDDVLPKALSVDSTQGTPDEMSQDEWIDAMTVGERFVTNPNTWHPL